MGEQDHRPGPGVGEGRFGRDRPDQEHRLAGRAADVDPLFDRAGGGGVPDSHPHRRAVLGVAQGGGGVGGLQVALARRGGLGGRGEA